MGRLILHAPGVHVGGGLVILKELLSKTNPKDTILFIDERAFDVGQEQGFRKIYTISHSIVGRIRAEYLLRKICQKNDTILCFHGLPPFFLKHGNIVVFEQNRLHIEKGSLSKYPIKTRIRLNVERTVCSLFKNRVKLYIVQTKSMFDTLIKWHGKAPKIHIIPIMYSPSVSLIKEEIVYEKKYDLVYIADGGAHKNHHNLILSLVLLSQANLFPSLCLTIPFSNKGLINYLNDCIDNYKIRVKNIGVLPHEEIWELYNSSRALIFPSTVESFGLPLLEATKFGLPIIAAEKDYVRDVCIPAETFDPHSPTSISRAIKRFLKINEPPLRLFDASEFIKKIETI